MKQAKLSEQIRQAVKDSGLSNYRICKSAGIYESVMSRFMRGVTGLQQDNLDALAEVLGLRIVVDGTKGKTKAMVQHGVNRK